MDVAEDMSTTNDDQVAITQDRMDVSLNDQFHSLHSADNTPQTSNHAPLSSLSTMLYNIDYSMNTDLHHDKSCEEQKSDSHAVLSFDSNTSLEMTSLEDNDLNLHINLHQGEIPTYQSHKTQENMISFPNQASSALERCGNSSVQGSSTAIAPSCKTTVFTGSYSRKQDKIQQLETHPIIEKVYSDGKSVVCKCGKLIRLNPAWYIAKFEDHIVSRNCTFLRKKLPKTKRKRQSYALADGRLDYNTKHNTDWSSNEILTVDTSFPNGQSIGSKTGDELPSASGNAPVQSTLPCKSMKTNNYGLQKWSTAFQDVEAVAAEFIQKSNSTIILESCKMVSNSMEEMTTAKLSGILDVPHRADHDTYCRKILTGCILRNHPHFRRITPDGLFMECQCSNILVLHVPWDLHVFMKHLINLQQNKNKTQKCTSTDASADSCAGAGSKIINNANIYELHNSLHKRYTQRIPFKNVLSTSSNICTTPSANRVDHNGFGVTDVRGNRSFRWEPISKAPLLRPCPGIRNEQAKNFASISTPLQTGGHRSRSIIARELFTFLQNNTASQVSMADVGLDNESANYSECDSSDDLNGIEGEKLSTNPNSISKWIGKKRDRYCISQLSEEQKLLLHDAMESESIWLIDKEGHTIRSLSCHGIVYVRKDCNGGEEMATTQQSMMCPACLELCKNPKYIAALNKATKRFQNKENGRKNPMLLLHSKFRSNGVSPCPLFNLEFNMMLNECRILRDILLLLEMSAYNFMANIWLELGVLGLLGAFDDHKVLLGLIECMVMLREKECRGVGMQNMRYNEELDKFLDKLGQVSSDALRLFQHHLCGRRYRIKRQKLNFEISAIDPQSKSEHNTGNHSREVTNSLPPCNSVEIEIDSHANENYSVAMSSLNEQETGDARCNTGEPHVAFENMSGMTDKNERHCSIILNERRNTTQNVTLGSNKNDANDSQRNSATFITQNKVDSCRITTPRDRRSSSSNMDYKDINKSRSAPDDCYQPCSGLRDESVKPYVINAYQLLGGARPKYVLAKELFPEAFRGAKKIQIVDRLSSEQKDILQDAVFSSSLWRVDKVGQCVRSLKCARRVTCSSSKALSLPDNNKNIRNSSGKTTTLLTTEDAICNACRDLKRSANFRSVISRGKATGKSSTRDSLKYVPSVFTASDPFLRLLTKNSSFRSLCSIVQEQTSESVQQDENNISQKNMIFWLKCVKMGLLGQFRTYPVFESLIETMVEIQDKARRGVGRQNITYSKPLDEFTNTIALISMEAFELFSREFCARAARSNKIKQFREQYEYTASSHHSSTVTTQPNVNNLPNQNSTTSNMLNMDHPTSPNVHSLIEPDEDLLSDRGISSSDLDYSQQFMDRMLGDVRLSVNSTMHLHEGDTLNEENDPTTYLDETN